MGQKLTGAKARAKDRSRRIKSELKGFGTLRDLHREVRKRLGEETRGSSYGAVRAIVEGEVDHPRPNVLQAIGDVLGVSLRYLMDLEGPRRAPEDVQQPQPPASTEVDQARERAFRALTQLGEGVRASMAHEVPPTAQRQLIDSAIDILTADGTRLDGLEAARVARAAGIVASFWSVPSRVFSESGWGLQRSPEWLRAYYSAMSIVISLAASESGADAPDRILHRMEAAVAGSRGEAVKAPKFLRRYGGVAWAPFCLECLMPTPLERERPGAPLRCPECGTETELPDFPEDSE